MRINPTKAKRIRGRAGYIWQCIFRWRAHLAPFNHSAYSCRSVSCLTVPFFSFCNVLHYVVAWVNDASIAWPTSASGWCDTCSASAMAPTSSNRPNSPVLWNFWHDTLVNHMACVLANQPVVRLLLLQPCSSNHAPPTMLLAAMILHPLEMAVDPLTFLSLLDVEIFGQLG
jgi:hypothetical protein